MTIATHFSVPASTKALQRDYFGELNVREKQILGLVMRRSPISQSQLSKATGIAQQSMSRLVNNLIDRGALRTGEKLASGKRGQKRTKLEIVPEFAYSYGISIMTDAMHITAMNFAGEILGSEYIELPTMTQAESIKQIKAITANLNESYIDDSERIFGAGVSISGYLLENRTVVNTPPMLDEWALVDIAAIVSKELNLPTWLENDGNAAAIGESLVGAGRRYDDFVYMYFATGFGGGVISGGELLGGAHGNAGELALLLPPNIYPHPNLELLRQMIVKHGIEIDDVSELIDRFDINWPGVDEWINRVRDSINLVSSAAAALLDTEAIVIGGRMPSPLAEKLISCTVMFDNARRARPRPLPVLIPSETDGDASSIGAAALPFKEYFFGSLH